MTVNSLKTYKMIEKKEKTFKTSILLLKYKKEIYVF